MRINKFVAQASGLSRRAADMAIATGHIRVNDAAPLVGQEIGETDLVTLDGQRLVRPATTTTILLHKPVGYVCSRNGQGSSTVYDLLPPEFHHLKPVGRLDKDSSGLLLLTDDGELANRLTHPSFHKRKTYQIELNRPLPPATKTKIEKGIELDDGPSQLLLHGSDRIWQVTMHEGRNRQIRRTFAATGYEVIRLHRTTFGDYSLANMPPGGYEVVRGI